MTLLESWGRVEAVFFHPELRTNRILIRQARLMFATCAVGGVAFLFLILWAFVQRPQAAPPTI